MKPLIFRFLEKANMKNLDFSSITYDEKLNLSVDRVSKKPAIDILKLGTSTVTDVCEENSDCDPNNQDDLKLLMGTSTNTFASKESSDNDRDKIALEFLMGTMTKTGSGSGETSDSD